MDEAPSTEPHPLSVGDRNPETSAPRGGDDWTLRLQRALLTFFRRAHGEREMPWRRTEDPYAIWVSEVMLQQTRVETVVPYFNAWMERFPTVEALAAAPEEEVLKRWEGLGYYSRARNLHRAAAVVRERHGGQVPETVEGLRDLPGVGPYTAGAVASIAFGVPVPAVDGNVRRVVARLLDWPDPTPRELEETVARWVPEEAPGDFNQALMELGATVCTPRNPACPDCPVEALCGARAAGTVEERPAPRKRAPVRREVHAVTVAVRHDGAGAPPRLALRRRPDRGLLAGMWEFPGTPVEDPAQVPEVVMMGLFHLLPLEGAGEAHLLPVVRHTFTHLQVDYHPLLVRLFPGASPPHDAEWLTPDQIQALPLPVAQQSIVGSALEVLGDTAG